MVDSLNSSYWRYLPKRGTNANLRATAANLQQYEVVYSTDLLSLFVVGDNTDDGYLVPIGYPRILHLSGFANFTLSVPAGHAIDDVFIHNTTANAITGNIKIGTTNGGTEIATAITVGANAFVRTLAKDLNDGGGPYSPTAATTIYIQSTNWNGAFIDIVFPLKRAIP